MPPIENNHHVHFQGLFNSSSIFNITLREELFSLPKKNQTCCLVTVGRDSSFPWYVVNLGTACRTRDPTTGMATIPLFGEEHWIFSFFVLIGARCFSFGILCTVSTPKHRTQDKMSRKAHQPLSRASVDKVWRVTGSAEQETDRYSMSQVFRSSIQGKNANGRSGEVALAPSCRAPLGSWWIFFFCWVHVKSAPTNRLPQTNVFGCRKNWNLALRSGSLYNSRQKSAQI